MLNKIVIMVGISGSGKSFFVSKHYTDAVVCSADHYFYNKQNVYEFKIEELRKSHITCFNKFKTAIIEDKPLIVVDNTNLTLKEIKEYVKFADENQCETIFNKMICPVSIAVERNKHNIPEKTILKQYKRLQSLDLSTFNKKVILHENIL